MKQKILNVGVVELETDRDRQAELILVRTCEDSPSWFDRKHFCDELGVPWGEYLRLRRKYSRILKRYIEERGRTFEEVPEKWREKE